ncbi:hypothetical protein [Pseudoduganella sp. RAF53_2]|uniref:hypothetical protein n=1 Tax=unclassified Pseudoduganella TaxID=2637179 RepID=UPI003F96BC55
MKVFFRLAVLAAMTTACSTEPAPHKLPLDHGPRATSTPWLNQQLAHSASVSSCPADRSCAAGNPP